MALQLNKNRETKVKLVSSGFCFNRGRKPEKILYFRDGVSEGQFEEVLNREISAIQRACRSLQDDWQPGITFLVFSILLTSFLSLGA
jgi:eukaryotic translation initiation factor 2C